MQDNLSDNQKIILKEFIKVFLPKRGSKRKNSGNELEYIGTTLDRVFKQNFGFNLSRQNVLEMFEELQYDIFTKTSDWDSEQKIYKPSKKGNSIRIGDGYTGNNAAFIYLDIEPSIVRQLMLATFSPLPNTSEKKLKATEDMKIKIQLFKAMRLLH